MEKFIIVLLIIIATIIGTWRIEVGQKENDELSIRVGMTIIALSMIIVLLILISLIL
ncbi:hypothetical protein [Exercitatus varius]|uniref:hypothetical protein n=1 Tax=Exercitatus varius TaxID=67857 RepID=UPI00294B2D04|nr:hypothetical protein [Exercitatus varius]MDG2961686.1 hypothetical protein [Exercitatus varius]